MVKKIICLFIYFTSLNTFSADAKSGYLVDKNSGCKIWTGDIFKKEAAQ
jgi:hypothetical protein